VTEQEWPECEDPQKMLDFLRERASDRKLWLFACACCRRIGHLLTDERSQRAVVAAEQFADGLITEQEFEDARWKAVDAYSKPHEHTPHSLAVEAAADAACCACWDDFTPTEQEAHGAARTAAQCCERAVNLLGSDVAEEKSAQAALLRCIVGPISFHPVTLEPTWRTTAVVQLARSLYEERRFEDMPVLADALEEAGCQDAAALGHCRGPGPHVRGCWLLDLLLGKA